MGRRGPAPAPTAVLNARGSWRGKINPSEPSTVTGMPPCPPRLSSAAAEVWASIACVVAPGVISRDNGQALTRYCHEIARWWKLAAWLDKNPDVYTVTDQFGNERHMRHPNVITYENLGRSLLRQEQEFGLTPSSRTRIHAEAVKPCGEKKKPALYPTLKIA